MSTPHTSGNGPASHGPRTRKPLLLLGAGDMAITYVDEFAADPDYEIVGFVQDADSNLCGATLKGRPVLDVAQTLALKDTHSLLCAIAGPGSRDFVHPFEEAGFHFATLVAPTAQIHDRSGIEPGCLISHFANVDPDVHLGRHTQLTSRVAIAHHSTIGSYGFLSPGVMIGGRCNIGERCFIGIGSIIRDHITIGDDATVGAGAVVVKDVPPGATVVGNPARPIRPKQRQPVLLLGAGEQAASYAENVSDLSNYEVVGFVQDVDPDRKISELTGCPVYYIDDVKDWARTHQVVCCIGSMKKRGIILRFEAMGFRFATLIASTALISPKAELGPGCFVSHTGQVASFARVGAHTMIGRQAMVGHHAEIGPYSLIAGGSIIGGGTKIGEGCIIGMGALVRDHVTIGDGATIGMGAVVVQDVPPGATVVGNPAHALAPK